MAKIVPLFSGSKGNSYFIGSSGEGVLIDAGRTCKQLENALALNNINISTVAGVFITHEHIDHCSGLRVLAKKHNLTVYASEGTLLAMEERGCLEPSIKTQVITNEVTVGNMLVKRCDTPHDAKESCIYSVITKDDRTATVATDIGIMTDEIRTILKNSDLAVIESNHDVRMLQQGMYPHNVKMRILSDLGHLSNEACAVELKELIKSGTTRLLLGHISENNNLPELALNTSLNTLLNQGMKKDFDFTLETVPPETLGKSVTF